MYNSFVDPIIASNPETLGFLSDVSNVFTILIRLLLVVLCAGMIGIERSKKKHSAGLRTYMLVCLGAAVIMILGDFLVLSMPDGTDVGRLGAQVISGIGFLGAGTILVTSKNRIKGLTTAAGLWISACIGLVLGAGFYTLGILATLITSLILSMLPGFERLLRTKTRYMELDIELHERSHLKELVNYLRSIDVRVYSVERNDAYHASGLSVYSVTLIFPKTQSHISLLESIKNLPYVNHCEEI